MKKQILWTVTSLALSASLAGSAAAEMIAGWDFSQYFADGFLTVDGATFQNTLPANYSNLDPTFGAGAESAQYGTMIMDGTAGSTQVVPGTGVEEFLPTTAPGTGSLQSNLSAPVTGPGLVPFDSFTVLTDEGQAFANPLAMTAQDAVSVVFEASVLSGATDWSLSLAARTFADNGTIGVEFSPDGVNYSSVGSIDINTVDAGFSLALSAVQSANAFVRLNFSAPGAGGSGQAIVDNVAISGTLIPEPGTLLLLGAGLAGLVVVGRRRDV